MICLENPMDGGAWQAAVHGVARVGHDLVTSLSLFTFMHWRRKWQPTPVFLPGESQGRGSLVSCRLWGRTESDTTEVTQQQLCENYKSNYVELVHSAFQIYCILLLFFLFILLIFENLILKLRLKTLIYPLKKIIVIHSGTICKFVLYFPVLLYCVVIISQLKK